MQFTELLDKNGKEIYEADIVRFSDDESLHEVFWDEKWAAFKIKNSPNKDESEFEVIGNIYENGNILKQEAYAAA